MTDIRYHPLPTVQSEEGMVIGTPRGFTSIIKVEKGSNGKLVGLPHPYEEMLNAMLTVDERKKDEIVETAQHVIILQRKIPRGRGQREEVADPKIKMH